MSKPIAFVFPGQGSQHLGMCQDLVQHYPIVKTVFDEASEVLGYDVWTLTQEGPENQLNQTEYTQPVLLVAGIATWRLWQNKHADVPSWLAGHSLGEYTALVAAESLNFADALILVRERGRYMQEAVPPGQGAMAAIIGLKENVVKDVCAIASKTGSLVSPANYNSIGQIVIAGETTAVDRAVNAAKEHGAKLAKKLPVSVPSHCELMKPAAEKLAIKLATISINKPTIPVIHNVDVCSYQDANQIKDALVRQLYNPVRWIETVQQMAEKGVEAIIESGPGKVLTGLNKRIVDNLVTIAITDSGSFEEAISFIGDYA